MAERFTRLFSLPENLYAEGSPIVITAGALQKDNQTEKVFVQLKFKSITDKTIKAVKVKLFPVDTIGNAIDGVAEYEYLDLSAVLDEEFGHKTAVFLPNASTRGFSVEVIAVYFADNSAWDGLNADWSSLPELETLEKSLADLELAKQYKLKNGADCKFSALEHKDLWFCTCGALNHRGEQCCICGREFASLKNFDLDELKAERDIRLEEERKKAEEDRKAAEERAEAMRIKAAETAKKTKKLAMILVPIVAIVVVAAVLISGAAKKSNAYKDAVALVEAGQYDKAITAFAALGDYKDSAKQIQIAETALLEEQNSKAYAEAMGLLKSDRSEDEDKAYHILKELGNYKDSQNYLASFVYKQISYDDAWYEYDTFGNLVEVDYGDYSYYYHYEDGRLVWEGISKSDWSTDKYSYYPDGTVKSCTRGIARTVSNNVVAIQTINYNEYGNPETVVLAYDNQPNEHEIWTISYTLADDGEITALDCSIDNYYIEETIIKSYDFSNFDGVVSVEVVANEYAPIRVTLTSADRTYEELYTIVKLSDTMRKDSETALLYDNFGKLLAKTTDFSKSKISYVFEYDDNGYLIEVTTTQDNNSYTHTYTHGYIYAPDAK